VGLAETRGKELRVPGAHGARAPARRSSRSPMPRSPRGRSPRAAEPALRALLALAPLLFAYGPLASIP
jgi:hypothetical protein